MSPCLVLPQVGLYLEQSELLDPLLEDLVTPLAAVLRVAAASPALSPADMAGLCGVSRLLWALARTRCVPWMLACHHHQPGALTRKFMQTCVHMPCRGRKTVMRFLPNETSDLEPVLALLDRLDGQVPLTLHPSCTAGPLLGHHNGQAGFGTPWGRLPSALTAASCPCSCLPTLLNRPVTGRNVAPAPAHCLTSTSRFCAAAGG